MDAGVARQHAGMLNPDVSSAQVRDDPSCFTDQQGACGNIPGREALLPETVEPSRRNVHQIECCCTWPAYSAGPARHQGELSLIFLEMRGITKRKAGTDQGELRIVYRGNLETL